MKNLRFTWVLAVGLGALGVTGCAEKESSVNELTVQANAAAPAGQIISSAQAVEWTTRFQEANPQEIWAVFTEAGIFNQLLSQADCQGLRLYHGTDSGGDNTFVMVGVNSEGADMTEGLLADEAAKCPPNSYRSILLAKPGEEPKAPVLPAGTLIPLDKAIEMTMHYQAKHAGSGRAGYFSSRVYWELLEQPGCIGIRVYKGLKEGNIECFVLVGVNEKGVDMTEGLLYDMAAPCPPNCSAESPLMHGEQ
ncbi:hypothetical protein [Hymenobacter elongatus]|uniref:Lipoprotein n=1 Tax=Hymenobacter elongatus TaxID=877208 RepID=A0A4Z0PKJ8_9BACT|nr:hypothetical protein [Hymenobacter elongatus]TGE16447.1 hypothetical protein E5J99_09990 [Hymenobacter elongatus]